MLNSTTNTTMSLLIAASSAMAGDVLQVDSMTSEISGYFQSSCGNDGDSYSDSADDFAELPITIDETADCQLFGNLSSSTEGSIFENGFVVTTGTEAGGNEDFGEYIYAYSYNDTVVSFTILRDAHVRFETCKTGYHSDYYDMGSTYSSGSALLTNTATGDVVTQIWASSTMDGTSCGFYERMLPAGSYTLTFEFDAGSSCNCGSSTELQISLQARPVPSMTIFDGIGVFVQQDFTGEFPAESTSHDETQLTESYEDLPSFFSRSFEGDEDGSCYSVDADRNRCSTATRGIANGNVIVLTSEATTRTAGDTNAGLCYLAWQSDIYYDFDFQLQRASTIDIRSCHDSSQHPYPGDEATDADSGSTEIRVWEPATKQSFYYSFLESEGTECDSVEIELPPGAYRLWADSHASSAGKRGRTTTAELELTFHDLADLDRDGRVNGADIAILLGAWGACGDCPSDINGDGSVSGADLSLVLGGWAP